MWWQSWLHRSGTDRAYITIQTWDLAQKSLTDKKQIVVTVTERLKEFVGVTFGSAEFGCEVGRQSQLQGSGTDTVTRFTSVRLGSEELDCPKPSCGYCDQETQRVCVISGSAEFGCEVWWQSHDYRVQGQVTRFAWETKTWLIRTWLWVWRANNSNSIHGNPSGN